MTPATFLARTYPALSERALGRVSDRMYAVANASHEVTDVQPPEGWTSGEATWTALGPSDKYGNGPKTHPRRFFWSKGRVTVYLDFPGTYNSPDAYEVHALRGATPYGIGVFQEYTPAIQHIQGILGHILQGDEPKKPSLIADEVRKDLVHARTGDLVLFLPKTVPDTDVPGVLLRSDKGFQLLDLQTGKFNSDPKTASETFEVLSRGASSAQVVPGTRDLLLDLPARIRWLTQNIGRIIRTAYPGVTEATLRESKVLLPQIADQALKQVGWYETKQDAFVQAPARLGVALTTHALGSRSAAGHNFTMEKWAPQVRDAHGRLLTSQDIRAHGDRLFHDQYPIPGEFTERIVGPRFRVRTIQKKIFGAFKEYTRIEYLGLDVPDTDVLADAGVLPGSVYIDQSPENPRVLRWWSPDEGIRAVEFPEDPRGAPWAVDLPSTLPEGVRIVRDPEAMYRWAIEVIDPRGVAGVRRGTMTSYGSYVAAEKDAQTVSVAEPTREAAPLFTGKTPVNELVNLALPAIQTSLRGLGLREVEVEAAIALYGWVAFVHWLRLRGYDISGSHTISWLMDGWRSMVRTKIPAVVPPEHSDLDGINASEGKVFLYKVTGLGGWEVTADRKHKWEEFVARVSREGVSVAHVSDKVKKNALASVLTSSALATHVWEQRLAPSLGRKGDGERGGLIGLQAALAPLVPTPDIPMFRASETAVGRMAEQVAEVLQTGWGANAVAIEEAVQVLYQGTPYLFPLHQEGDRYGAVDPDGNVGNFETWSARNAKDAIASDIRNWLLTPRPTMDRLRSGPTLASPSELRGSIARLHTPEGLRVIRKHFPHLPEAPWTHGGCWILAEALTRTHVGCSKVMIQIASGDLKGKVPHVLVQTPYGLADAEGIHKPDTLIPGIQSRFDPTGESRLELVGFESSWAHRSKIPFKESAVLDLMRLLTRPQ